MKITLTKTIEAIDGSLVSRIDRYYPPQMDSEIRGAVASGGKIYEFDCGTLLAAPVSDPRKRAGESPVPAPVLPQLQRIARFPAALPCGGPARSAARKGSIQRLGR